MGGGGVSRCLKGINASFREILGNKVVWCMVSVQSRIPTAVLLYLVATLKLHSSLVKLCCVLQNPVVV